MRLMLGDDHTCAGMMIRNVKNREGRGEGNQNKSTNKEDPIAFEKTSPLLADEQ